MIKVREWICVLAICVPALVRAQVPGEPSESGFYLGGSAGMSQLSAESDVLLGTFSTREIGFKVIAGYGFNQYVSVEAAYYNPGEAKDNVPGIARRITADVAQASILGRFPWSDQISLIARLGVSHWEAELFMSNGSNTIQLEDDDIDLNWAVAAEWHVTDHFDLRLEWDQTRIGSQIGALPLDFKLRFTQLGALWRF
jgi:OOP family OmpA-OmpF porin